MPASSPESSYPSGRAPRDAWVVAHRLGIDRQPDLAADRAVGWLLESELGPSGSLEPGLTVFLTNRECPWRCVLCDLWRHTLPESVPVGAILKQLAGVQAEVVPDPARRWVKLYNAGSFFDAGAIPPEDHEGIARWCDPYHRVTVESHPSLIGPRVWAFRERLRPGTQLEVAMGLETAHPEVLERLNKGITLEGFRRAVKGLKAEGCLVRVFVLVKPPFLADEEAVIWGERSVEFALECGADVVSLIPTRGGNGAMESLARQGQFAPPSIDALEAVLRHGLGLGQGRIFADLWDLERFVRDPERCGEVRDRLDRMNRTQRVE
jgi:radical SAM enzyme (TIGR01210 family)